MAAVAGILFTDVLGLGDWWTAGAKEYAIDTQTQLAVLAVTFAALETKRIENYRAKGVTGFLSFAPFDPLNMKSKEMEQKEIKNARLAMVAFVGFASQAAVRGLGPVECLQAHLADTTHVNIYTSSVGTEAVVAVIALNLAPLAIIASKSFGGSDKEEFKPIPW